MEVLHDFYISHPERAGGATLRRLHISGGMPWEADLGFTSEIAPRYL